VEARAGPACQEESMKRVMALGVLLGVGALSVAVAARQQGQGARVVEVEKLKDNLYLLKGGGGNTAVFVGSSGVTVVDTKLPGWGQPIIDAIKDLTPKPVTTIINTHTHGDHVSGNVEFPATVDIIVQDNTRANMAKMMSPPGMGSASPAPTIFDRHNGAGMPKRTFSDRMTIGGGADEIDLYYFGRGHTNGDAWVVFPALRFVHSGDIFAGKGLPILDTNNGGSGLEIGDSLARAHDGIKNVDAIITGHSTVMTWADLAEYAQFNKDFAASVQAGLAAGKSPDEIAAAWKIDGKYQGYSIDAGRLRQNVNVIAGEVKR
jgi:glyoxylase-like metal-dependent hydrolase (beta-lactamase superfamily II)